MSESRQARLRAERLWWLKHIDDDDIPWRARRIAEWYYGLGGQAPISMKEAAGRYNITVGWGYQLLGKAKAAIEAAKQ